MKHRVLGRTGLKVSAVGLGGHEYRRKQFVVNGRFTELDPDRPSLIAEAVQGGVNYLDTTFIEECQSLGYSIREGGIDRESIMISGMSIDMLRRIAEIDVSGWEAFVERERLELLGTDYFDVFHICAIESGYDQTVLDGVLKILARWRDRGYIRYLGASAHDPDLLSSVIEERDPFDVVMAPFNFRIGRNERLLRAIAERNIGFVVIKPLVWFEYGVSFIHLCRSVIEAWPKSAPSAAQNALAWLLTQTEVSTIVPSANSLEESKDNIAAVDVATDSIDLELLEACAALPNRTGEMIELLNHPFEEVRSYAKQAVVAAVGNDYGFDTERYIDAIGKGG